MIYSNEKTQRLTGFAGYQKSKQKMKAWQHKTGKQILPELQGS